MLTNISWKEYSIFILIVSFIYYTTIVIIFYKREIFQFVNNLQLLNKSFNDFNKSDKLEKRKSDLHSADAESSHGIMQLKEEIKMQLERAKLERSIREEIIMSLQLVLQNYCSIKQSQFKVSIDHYIKDMSENICSIHLDDKEIENLWFR